MILPAKAGRSLRPSRFVGGSMESLIARLLTQFESGKMNRRELIRSLALAATGTAAATKAASAAAVPAAGAQRAGFTTVGLSHLSYQVADYRVSRDFYVDLMGMEVALDADTGGRAGESLLTWSGGRGPLEYMIVRNRTTRPGQPVDPNPGPRIDHIGFEIEDWDTKGVEDELKSRGYEPFPDTEDSWFIPDPDGYNLQICGPGLSAENPVYKG